MVIQYGRRSSEIGSLWIPAWVFTPLMIPSLEAPRPVNSFWPIELDKD